MAPVVHSDTLQILLAIASVKDWIIHWCDVKTSFLNSKIDHVLYIKQPIGYKQENLVCLLNNAFYGLVQSAHLWFEDLKSTLLKMSFVQSNHNNALFYNTANKTYITFYVDNIKVFAPSHNCIDAVKEKLFAKYKITNEEDVKWYLGMEINCLPDGALFLTQIKYIWNFLAQHGMDNCSKVLIPMSLTKLEKAPEKFVADPKDLNNYQTLLGKLMHLMVQTRSDLAQAITRLA